MYFEIENTPEHIRKARRAAAVQKELPTEEVPRLTLAPFCKPPQVVFDNVLIGTSSHKTLEVFNPSKHAQQITLGRALPEGLVINLPGEWIELEPETCYTVGLTWTPVQPTALRDTIRFTNSSRGRYDVIIVLKSVLALKGKGSTSKMPRTSPGKIKKNVMKKSPIAYKKKSEVIYNTTKMKKIVNVVQSSMQTKVFKTSNKENVSPLNISLESQHKYCPFGSPNSADFSFDTSKVFANIKKNSTKDQYIPNNILRPSNKQFDTSGSDLFDNLTFTPLKTIPNKREKLDKGPKIIISMNSESDLNDSLDIQTANKENESHSIMYVSTSQAGNNWMNINHHTKGATEGTTQTKKIPNTSSPKEMNSPNFSINTDFSRISDLSFFPSRFSTEKKVWPALNNDTHEIEQIHSDTYTKESPYLNKDFLEHQPPHYFVKDHYNKGCRQSLFREYHQKYAYDKRVGSNQFENNIWQNELRSDCRSTPRSISPPLQSIVEESAQCSDLQISDRTDRQTATFTINRTFNKNAERNSISINNNQSWSKKAIRTAEELWKVPVGQPKKSLKPRPSLTNEHLNSGMVKAKAELHKTENDTILLGRISNVYSQSLTVDPFLSTSYFYDESAVSKLQKEFTRWLNYVLSPPADLDSDIEQKIDVGKAWIENRNKEIPLAPTKEHVSSVYHNSHRLQSLRKAAKAMLISSEMSLVFMKLNAQIDKKLIAIRTDRNLHLDVGLQKLIMELLLSYNPLWLRIGLETIYNLVLPLKSNSDIDGIASFIIERMFRNPNIKNKHSKTSAPNMLLPAYMESIKKFTLKKFFALVYFLDQAKEKKLIPHDPCLFCRNAVCKESREIILRFTRELIAGIGDITKHLRPLGYVVKHKQSFLDEYKYAVNNLAIDLRDGIRLTKVMEVILIRNGLLHHVRAPAISRLQKIHNVQIALNALIEANFSIEGEITARDIADGHREKTLSLLWQLIHVFRAPLFVKAATVIQIWWKKKYEVIINEREKKEQAIRRLHSAATVIQCWWRRLYYSKIEYCQLLTSVRIIQERFRSILLMRKERQKYLTLKKYAIFVQRQYRALLAMKDARHNYLQLLAATIFIQRKYRAQKLMKYHRNKYIYTLKACTIIQASFRGYLKKKKQRNAFLKLRQSAIVLQQRYRAIIAMRRDRKSFLTKRAAIALIQNQFLAYSLMKKERTKYLATRNACVTIQRAYRAYKLGQQQRSAYLKVKSAVTLIQKRYRSLLYTKRIRSSYEQIRKIAIMIQRRFRAVRVARGIRRRNAARKIQLWYRSIKLRNTCRTEFEKLRQNTVVLQSKFRMIIIRKQYLKLKSSVVMIQRFYRAYKVGTDERQKYIALRNSIIKLQACAKRNFQRKRFLQIKSAALTIQIYCRANFEGRKQRQAYLQLRQSVITLQQKYRAILAMKRERKSFLIKRAAIVLIQTQFKAYTSMKKERIKYLKTKNACVTIQNAYRAYKLGQQQRSAYLKIKFAVTLIQKRYRLFLYTKSISNNYMKLRNTTIMIQRRFRAVKLTRDIRRRNAARKIQIWYRSLKLRNTCRTEFLKLKQSAVVLQSKFRMIIIRKQYLKLKSSIVTIQRFYRAYKLTTEKRMKYIALRNTVIKLQACAKRNCQRKRFLLIKSAALTIQILYRAKLEGTKQRIEYLQLRKSVITLQQRYKAILAMRRERNAFLTKRAAVALIQNQFKAYTLMKKERTKYLTTKNACVTIQRAYRAYKLGQQQRFAYLKIKSAVTLIQKRYRLLVYTKQIHQSYQHLRNTTIMIQRRFKAVRVARNIRRLNSARKIQVWYKSIKLRNTCRTEFLKLKSRVILIQSKFRMIMIRKQYLKLKSSVEIIQRFYRAYKLGTNERQKYIALRKGVIKLQAYAKRNSERKRFLQIKFAVVTIQAAYRSKRQRDIINKQRIDASICIQKYIRRYLVQSRYQKLRKYVMTIQKLWRAKLVARLMRCNYLQMKRAVIQLQALIRGSLVRRNVLKQKENITKMKEMQKQNWAASKIQALFRGHKVRASNAEDTRVAELRYRWRTGALRSTQETLKERNEEVLDVLNNMADIETVIRVFKSLELVTEVYPMMYNDNAKSVVNRVYIYMSVTNRSISSIEMLKSAASVLVNLTRYKVTGPKIYKREHIPPTLKFMWRFSKTDTQLFCILSTYLWLFSKYEQVRKDLTEFLHIPENHKMLMTIKGNVQRMKRMTNNALKSKHHIPTPVKLNSSLFNGSICGNILPALEPDYGIVRINKPRHFEDAEQAISCLFHTYKL